MLFYALLHLSRGHLTPAGVLGEMGFSHLLGWLSQSIMCKQIRYAEVVGAAAVYLMHLSYKFNSFLIAYNTAHCAMSHLY